MLLYSTSKKRKHSEDEGNSGGEDNSEERDHDEDEEDEEDEEESYEKIPRKLLGESQKGLKPLLPIKTKEGGIVAQTLREAAGLRLIDKCNYIMYM